MLVADVLGVLWAQQVGTVYIRQNFSAYEMICIQAIKHFSRETKPFISAWFSSPVSPINCHIESTGNGIPSKEPSSKLISCICGFRS